MFPLLRKLDDLLGNDLSYRVCPVSQAQLSQGFFEHSSEDLYFVRSKRVLLQQPIYRHHKSSHSLDDIHSGREPFAFAIIASPNAANDAARLTNVIADENWNRVRCSK